MSETDSTGKHITSRNIIYDSVGNLGPNVTRWLTGKEFACQCRRQGFNPWIRKMPWRKKWQSTPVFLPEKIPWTEESGGV